MVDDRDSSILAISLDMGDVGASERRMEDADRTDGSGTSTNRSYVVEPSVQDCVVLNRGFSTGANHNGSKRTYSTSYSNRIGSGFER